MSSSRRVLGDGTAERTFEHSTVSCRPRFHVHSSNAQIRTFASCCRAYSRTEQEVPHTICVRFTCTWESTATTRRTLAARGTVYRNFPHPRSRAVQSGSKLEIHPSTQRPADEPGLAAFSDLISRPRTLYRISVAEPVDTETKVAAPEICVRQAPPANWQLRNLQSAGVCNLNDITVVRPALI